MAATPPGEAIGEGDDDRRATLGDEPIEASLQPGRPTVARDGHLPSAGVADQFIYERVRNTEDLQRVPLRHFVGKQSAKLVIAVELMEANIREPISQQDLAAYVDLSRRQLQRLLQNYLLCTPSRYYRQLRLQRARDLLHQTDLNLVEVAAQTGFVSTSHFSKSYKEHYGYSPSAERRQSVPGLLS